MATRKTHINNPKTAKGSKRLYEVNAAKWFDLLGYGSMLASVNFDPTKLEAQKAIERLNNFHLFASKHARKNFTITAINDGVIIVKDLSPRARSVTFDFLTRAIELFQKFNVFDAGNGYPGARMVIASGFRIRNSPFLIFPEHGQITNIKTRVANELITTNQAINEAYKVKPYFGLMPEIQANFAFTKAYLVDNLGTKGGFPGPNFFIDMSFFEHNNLSGITFKKIIDWEQMGMKSKFGQLGTFERDSFQQKDVSDAFEIAQKISSQENVTNLLKQSTFKDTRAISLVRPD